MTRANGLDQFWARVDKSGPGGCWLWIGSHHPKGYGKVRAFGQSKLVHRFAYEVLVGPIPAGMTLDHLCRIRHCVNPAHLEPVTNRENILRGEAPPAVNATKTHCGNGHPFNAANTYITPHGYRHCRACNRLAAAAYKARQPRREMTTR